MNNMSSYPPIDPNVPKWSDTPSAGDLFAIIRARGTVPMEYIYSMCPTWEMWRSVARKCHRLTKAGWCTWENVKMGGILLERSITVAPVYRGEAR